LAAPNAAANLAARKTYGYAAASSWDATMGPERAFDEDPGTCWQGAAGTAFESQWLEVDLGVATTIDACTISEYGDRTAGFRIDYAHAGVWQTAYTGTTIGASLTVTFPRVAADKVRLVFTQGSFTPIIFELALYDRVACASSSDWDASQVAANAFDGDGVTWWQAAPGSVFGEQWL